jgi:very-short-patch-repair endonuclease
VAELPGHSDRFLQSPSVEELAARQHGVFALWQVELSADAARRRVERGKVRRIHRGVYAVGLGRLTKPGSHMAAVLAYGPDAVLSHRAAADHLGLRFSASAAIDVTVPRRGAKSRKGIRVHYGRVKPVNVDAIPCTTVARTILDCAEILPAYAIENMIDRAEQLQTFDLRAIEAELNGRRGAKGIRGVLKTYKPDPGTRNDFERLLLRICRGAGIRDPEMNVMVEGEERDLVWREERVIAEADGRERHNPTRQFEEDRRKDQDVAGEWIVLRFTWRQLTTDPQRVARRIAAVLTRPPS